MQMEGIISYNRRLAPISMVNNANCILAFKWNVSFDHFLFQKQKIISFSNFQQIAITTISSHENGHLEREFVQDALSNYRMGKDNFNCKVSVALQKIIELLKKIRIFW